ncbi:SDR family oxidoreductase [Marinobacteraceae bacterium S3BR75-40.1]
MSKNILITGASSGIGEHLALELAKRGNNLALCARNEDKLNSLSERIRAAHPKVTVVWHRLDVQEDQTIAPTINILASKLGQLDTVIANAGIAGGGAAGSGRFEEDRAIIRTNVLGAMATVDAAVALFRQQGKGHIVAISSVAAFRGMPKAGAYCASKAALATYMEAVEAEHYHSPIDVTTLFPGYIDTPLNQMLKNRPFLISVEKGAQVIADLIEKRVHRSTVPVYPWSLIGRMLKVVPTRLLASQGSFT